MFKKRNSHVKLNGRAGIEYTLGDRVMLIDSEMLAGRDFDMVIYTDSIRRWEPPHNEEAIDPDTYDQIVADIRDQLRQYSIDWQ